MIRVRGNILKHCRLIPWNGFERSLEFFNTKLNEGECLIASFETLEKTSTKLWKQEFSEVPNHARMTMGLFQLLFVRIEMESDLEAIRVAAKALEGLDIEVRKLDVYACTEEVASTYIWFDEPATSA